MNAIIRWVGMLIAQRIQQGSLAAAAAGALGGAAAGVGLVWLAEWLRDAPIPLHPVAAGIMGAFIGTLATPALYRRAPAPTGRVTRPRGALGAVRVTNLNVALGKIVAAVVFCGAVGGLIAFALFEQVGWSVTASALVGGAAALAGAAVLCALPVLWVDVSDNGVTLRKLFGGRAYSKDEVRRWGFEVSRGRATLAAPSGPCYFVVELIDGTFFEVLVSPHKAADLEAVIQPAAGRS
jgi:hypothetical protein